VRVYFRGGVGIRYMALFATDEGDIIAKPPGRAWAIVTAVQTRWPSWSVE